MTTQYWLVKQEPAAYAWEKFLADGRAIWDGVRSFPARKHLRAMRPGDRVLYYHSVEEKSVVGVARVARAAFPDPTAPAGEDWVAVELVPDRALPRPVTLAKIKTDPALRQIMLVRQGRLSVMPLTRAEFDRILALGGA